MRMLFLNLPGYKKKDVPLCWSRGILNGRVPYGTGDLSEIRSLVYSSVSHVREIASPLEAASPLGAPGSPRASLPAL